MAFSHSQSAQIGAQSRIGEHGKGVRRKETVGVCLDADSPDNSADQSGTRDYPGAMGGGGFEVHRFTALDAEPAVGEGPVQEPSNSLDLQN